MDATSRFLVPLTGAGRDMIYAVSLGLVLFGGLGGAIAQQGGQEDDGAFALGSQGRMVRGTVTATAADRLTLKTENGDLFQVSVTSNTRMMKERQPVKLSDIHSGDGVGAMGVVDAQAKTVHAAMLFVMDAAQVKKAREDLGKTYISGKVMAVDELELTIRRPDGVNQKIAVDEGTSFKRGSRRAGAAMRGDGATGADFSAAIPGQAGAGKMEGESITLADVKVGDVVMGTGALKSGTFVPVQLMVFDAASTARRRRSEATGDTNPVPASGPN